MGSISIIQYNPSREKEVIFNGRFDHGCLIYAAYDPYASNYPSANLIMSQESLWSNFTAQYHGSQLQDVRTSLREPANYQARLCSICTFLLIFGFPVLLPYLFSIFFVSDEDGKDQSLECIPPSYPNCLPLFGHALAFASDMPGTITRFAYKSSRPCQSYAF